MQWLHVQNAPDPLRRSEDKNRISMNYKPDLSRHQASSTLIRGQGGPWGLTLQAQARKQTVWPHYNDVIFFLFKMMSEPTLFNFPSNTFLVEINGLSPIWHQTIIWTNDNNLQRYLNEDIFFLKKSIWNCSLQHCHLHHFVQASLYSMTYLTLFQNCKKSAWNNFKNISINSTY